MSNTNVQCSGITAPTHSGIIQLPKILSKSFFLLEKKSCCCTTKLACRFDIPTEEIQLVGNLVFPSLSNLFFKSWLEMFLPKQIITNHILGITVYLIICGSKEAFDSDQR